jgi:hypothetical protein
MPPSLILTPRALPLHSRSEILDRANEMSRNVMAIAAARLPDQLRALVVA